MAKLKLKFRDVSRMSKKYPYTRHLPRTQLVSDKQFELEVIEVDVSTSDGGEKVITWTQPFGGVPSVTATVVMKSGDKEYGSGSDADKLKATALAKEMANVNVWIKVVSSTSCTLCFSDDEFVGTVNVQAIWFQ